MEWNALVPELVVADYERSKAFYVDVFGFSVRFERPESRFGYFDLGGAQIMLLEDTNRPIYAMHRPGPKGKGLHFQIELPSISAMLERLDTASIPLAADVVESWYRQDTLLHGQKEFFVADPDGYLYRFYEYIGERCVLANSPVVVNALVESLRHDPFYVAITAGYDGDETRRSAALSRYFDYSMSEGARVGRCIQSVDAPAAAVWLLPLSPERAAAQASAKAAFIRSALEPEGAENYHRIVDFMASRSRPIVSSAAWYLSIVGVAPGAQGQGVGGKLIRSTLAEADQVGASSFLETFSQRNVGLYERLGFAVVASYEEPITQSQYWIMQRAPNTSPERTQ